MNGAAVALALGDEAAERSVRAVEDAWRRGVVPDLEALWAEADRAPGVLPPLLKADLRCRFALGERPEVAEYLARFPQLQGWRDRVVSLVYEEYCLREEGGQAPDPSQFCERYEPWRDSLESQLRFHRMLSRVAGSLASRPRFPEPGGRFDRFRLDAILGRGGEGQVYLAREGGLGDRRVALKVSLDRGREPAVLGLLEHPHIVRVLSVTHEKPTGLRGLCMPYLPGQPLHEVIVRARPAGRPRSARALWDAAKPDVPHDEKDRPGWAGFPREGTYADGAAWVVMTLAHALGYAHSQGILHRDVKPANVLLTARDGPQLLDFNLAHDPLAAAEDARAARDGGTLPYMAPEQLDAFLDPGRRDAVREPADLYALGLVLVEMLTGDRPEGPDPALPLPRAIAELRDRRALGPIPSARAGNPTVPHALEAIASRCLAPRPEDRYASAADLAEDLSHFLARRPTRLARNPSRPERLDNYARRNRSPLAAALLFATIGVGMVPTLTARPPAQSANPAVGFLREAVKFEAEGRTEDARHAFGRADAVPLVQSLSAYRGAVRQRPDSASLQAGLGLALLKDSKLGLLADSAFVKAEVARDQGAGEGRIVAWLGRALSLEARGHMEQAEELYDRALKALRDRKDSAAETEVIRRVADSPGIAYSSLRIHNLLGSALLDGRDILNARVALTKASQREMQRLDGQKPQNQRRYYPLRQNLANLSFLNEDFEGACREISSAIELAATRVPKVDDGKLAGLYLFRADCRIHWADELRGPSRPSITNCRLAEPEYEGARDDLRIALSLGGKIPERGGEDRPTIDGLQAQAQHGLELLREQMRSPADPSGHAESAAPPIDRGLAG